jgi:type I restriction enzyme R subunit
VIARLVEAELLWGDGSQYLLGDFVIMPNHVHTLIEPLGDSRLSDILRSWKGRSARLINQRLNRAGRIWMPEYFDHLVRSYDHLLKYQDYIRRNPVTAGLSPGEFILGCGSANWRQEAAWLSAE